MTSSKTTSTGSRGETAVAAGLRADLSAIADLVTPAHASLTSVAATAPC